ncbi:MAG: right-handed parallel beta-helix repeat-containing protein, partial [Dokdonella sp.]
RDAITQANSLPNPGVITFAIPGACPRTITLASALPNITSPIIIDGSTQTGSSKNNAADAFNATLCVLVKPASGTIAKGFVAPSGAPTEASLTLRGIGMGGFGQPVLLIGGSNHVIAGNQFGGTVGGVPLPGAGLNAVSIGVNASGSLIVGGLNLADRNVIGGAGFSGIDVQGTVVSSPDKCQIVNNLIGLAPNAISALPNFTGITLGGSGCSVYSNRIAGNSNDNLWINGGSNNVVQRNILGVAINDSGFIGSAGLRISGGSGNIIGTSATSGINTSFLANTIRYNLDGGVLVVSGSNNSIRSNLIYDNGLSGEGMDIDLGANGATPNDADDADTGPNNLQNFPWTDLIVHPADDANPLDFVLNAHLNTLPGSYRIDAYFSNRCDNGAFHVTGRGHADAFVGTRLVTVPSGKNLVFSMPVTVPNALSTGVVSLTTTDALGNTSEIGSCAFLSNAQSDRIFANGFEGTGP